MVRRISGCRGQFGFVLGSVLLLSAGMESRVQARGPRSAAQCDGERDVDEALKAQDWVRARALLEPLAAAECPRSQLNLGLLYSRGLGVPESLEKARAFWKLSADAGYPQACWNVAVAMEAGDGGPVDRAGALDYLWCAAEQGYAAARVRLGKRCLEGTGGGTRQAGAPDRSLAFHWFLMAARAGDGEAAANLEEMVQKWPAEVDKWSAESLARLFSYSGESHSAGRVSLPPRSPELLYLVHDAMAKALSFQRSAWNPGGPTIPSRDSVQAVIASCDEALRGRGKLSAAQCILLQARGVGRKATPSTIMMPRRALYDVMAPGDHLLLSDQVTTHYTMVFGVDRQNGTVLLLDPWPEQFFLKPGSNEVGASAKVVDWRYGKMLVVVKRAELERALLAVLTVRDRPGATPATPNGADEADRVGPPRATPE